MGLISLSSLSNDFLKSVLIAFLNFLEILLSHTFTFLNDITPISNGRFQILKFVFELAPFVNHIVHFIHDFLNNVVDISTFQINKFNHFGFLNKLQSNKFIFNNR